MVSIYDPLVQTIVEQVFTILKDEAGNVVNFGDQFEQMKDHFATMKSFLSDTDNIEKKRELLKTCVIQLRDLTYEADNILTLCMIRDEHWSREKLCSRLSPLEQLFRYQTGKKLRHLNSKMKLIDERMGTYFVAQGGSVPRAATFKCSSPLDWEESEMIVGVESDVEKIKGWLLGSDTKQINLIGIVGMGGLGKTTIAHKVFKDEEVVSNFDHRIWLPVSQNFSEVGIMASLLNKLGHNIDDSRFGLDEMLRHIHELLKDKSFLIVLDDVWSRKMEWWETFRSYTQKPTGCGSKRSFLVITTRTLDVANSIGVDNDRVHYLRPLKADQSWSLLCKHAFRSSQGKCPHDDFRTLGKRIAEKCEGLPLTIKTIGALLERKQQSYNEWQKVYETFSQELKGNKQIMASLRLSYAELPSVLKKCLLCFSIYSEDVDTTDDLVRWWVAEGLVMGNSSKTAIEVGYECLSTLISTCLVEVEHRRCYDGRAYRCRLHDALRLLILSITKEEGLCNFDGCNGTQTLTAECRWLGLRNPSDEMKLPKKHRKLRVLVLLSHLDRSNMGVFESLRVLNLSRSRINFAKDNIDIKCFWNWISSLKCLAYLNLSNAAGLKKLPRVIGDLHNLQLLVLASCPDLSTMHGAITKLKRLVVLDLGLRPAIKCLPKGMGELSNLQELSGFKIVPGCHFLELKKLINLRVLRINVGKESSISKDERNVLSHLQNLKVLAIDTSELEGDDEMLDTLSPPPNLEELHLTGYSRGSLWKWMNPDGLSKLHYLCIEKGNLEQLSSECERHWKIEGLCLKKLPRLQVEWEALKKEMPFLSHVDASDCDKLGEIRCFDPRKTNDGARDGH